MKKEIILTRAGMDIKGILLEKFKMVKLLSKVGRAQEYLKEQELMYDDTFRYMMLSRMKSDCDVYLGESPQSHSAKRLWALEEKRHIEIMKNLYLSFPNKKKPQWISMNDIKSYEKNMLAVGTC